MTLFPLFCTRIIPAVAFMALGQVAFAVGSDDDTPPTPTETTTVCEDGMIWNPETELCETPTQESRLSDDMLYQTVRELAYAGQFDLAKTVLSLMSDQSSDRVLTYRGFITRSMGDMEGGMALYNAALAVNPDNLLARSYMGQALVITGDIEGAMTQLTEIGARGGTGGWPERALLEAIENGTPSFY